MQEPDWSAERALLLDTVLEAGEVALSYFNRDPVTWEKSDGAGPVTEADLATDKLLRERLLAARPSFGWLSEETEDSPDRLEQETVYIVDPIDGTRSFIGGSNTWAISAALTHQGSPVAAVVHLPSRGLTYMAALGHGATKNGAPISASHTSDPVEAKLLSAKINFTDSFWQRTPHRPDLSFRSSLAYRMALVAEGKFDAMITLRPTWEWDVAAGALLVTEAGGAASTTQGAPRFNSAGAQLPGLLAGAPTLIKHYVSHGPRLPTA